MRAPFHRSLTIALSCAAFTSSSSSTVLTAELKRLISESGAEVAVAYRTLDGRDEVLIDADKPFHAASTMKVPVMIRRRAPY